MAENYWKAHHHRAVQEALSVLWTESKERTVIAVGVWAVALTVLWVLGDYVDARSELILSIAFTTALFLVFPIVYAGKFISLIPRRAAEAATANATANPAPEEIELRRRDVAAQEVHNAILTAQLQQRDDEIKEAKEGARRKQAERLIQPEPAPDARLRFVWRDHMLLLEVTNLGIDADFDARIDLSLTGVPMKDHGPFPAVWLNNPEAETRRIPETVSDYVFIYEASDNGAAIMSAYFRYHLGKTIYSPKARNSWCYTSTPQIPPEAHRVKMVISANPRLRGGPKTIEFMVQHLAVTPISGEAQLAA